MVGDLVWSRNKWINCNLFFYYKINCLVEFSDKNIKNAKKNEWVGS